MSYNVPSWAGKPPSGLHLDVMKEDKLIQKLMIDEKKCYLFGRNLQLNDFCIDHSSCSRVHCAFVYHKHLNIAYLVDLDSTHGTFIGSIRLEANKPTQLHINSLFRFGASTRHYILRERPNRTNIMEDIPLSEAVEGMLGLPESQTELDNLTEYNTAHNRRITIAIGITDEPAFKKNLKSKKKRRGITFNEDEIIINPEDVDPNVGRFRNLIRSTVVPNASKKMRLENSIGIPPTSYQLTNDLSKHYQNIVPNLYQGLTPPSKDFKNDHSDLIDSDNVSSAPVQNSVTKILFNPAPDVGPSIMPSNIGMNVPERSEKVVTTENEPKKKKYAKEAWPGRKPLLSGL